jgi:arylsulfatase
MVLLVLSDNGASGEGGPPGRDQGMPAFNPVPMDFDAHIDDLGGPTTAPLHAVAMAGSTPNRRYMRFTHEGRTRLPLVVHWPNPIRDRPHATMIT